MKRLFLLACLGLGLSTQAQGLRLNEREYFSVAVFGDPFASFKEKGLLLGGEIEYVGKVYVRVSVSHFDALEDGYTDFIGGIGVNLTTGYFSDWRFYSGIRLGAIKRERANATAGLEAGIDYKVFDKVFVGVRFSYDYRSDQKFYDAPDKMMPNGFVRIGIELGDL